MPQGSAGSSPVSGTEAAQGLRETIPESLFVFLGRWGGAFFGGSTEVALDSCRWSRPMCQTQDSESKEASHGLARRASHLGSIQDLLPLGRKKAEEDHQEPVRQVCHSGTLALRGKVTLMIHMGHEEGVRSGRSAASYGSSCQFFSLDRARPDGRLNRPAHRGPAMNDQPSTP